MKNIPEVILALVLIVFASLIYGQTLQLPSNLSTGGLTPATFPKALAIIIGCLSTVLIIKGCFAKDGRYPGPAVGPQFLRMVIFFLVIVSYICLMPTIGYTVSTFSFLMVAVPLIMPQKSFNNIMKSIVFAILATTSVYAVFGIFLQVPLIEGPVDLFLRYRFFALLGAG